MIAKVIVRIRKEKRSVILSPVYTPLFCLL